MSASSERLKRLERVPRTIIENMNPYESHEQLRRAKQELKAIVNYQSPPEASFKMPKFIVRGSLLFMALGFIALGLGSCAMRQPENIDQISAMCTTMGGIASLILGSLFLLIIAIF